jgi:glycosyltransferase involved in cell wall biosynthesis
MMSSTTAACDLSALKVAIVHEWFVDYSGSERIVEQMLNIFPQADLYAQVEFLPEDLRWFIKHKKVTTSFIQKLPKAKTKYRTYLPLMPLAVEQFDLSGYDLVLSNNHAVSKGAITGPDQLHICVCCSPIRYAWDLTHQYLKESHLTHGLKSWLARYILHRIRVWDVRTANGVDEFVAISHHIARRIRKVYGRTATVIYPPVKVRDFNLHCAKDDFYLTASRMVPYKRIDLIVEAFAAMPDKKLVVIGDGPDFRKVQAKAGPNITLLGYQPFPVLKDHLQRARAFVFAAEEDFGILPVEAQACGTPVIAYGKGGALETVVDGVTGIFFDEQTTQSLTAAVHRFEQQRHQFAPTTIRNNALRFSVENFLEKFRTFVEQAATAKWFSREEKAPRRLSLIRGAEEVERIRTIARERTHNISFDNVPVGENEEPVKS